MALRIYDVISHFLDARMRLSFLELVSQAISDDKDEDPNSLFHLYKPVLDIVKKDIQRDSSLGNPNLFAYAEMLQFFTNTAALGEVCKACSMILDY